MNTLKLTGGQIETKTRKYSEKEADFYKTIFMEQIIRPVKKFKTIQKYQYNEIKLSKNNSKVRASSKRKTVENHTNISKM